MGACLKICLKCQESKPRSTIYFHAHPLARDKYNPTCKECANRRKRELWSVTKRQHKECRLERKRIITDFIFTIKSGPCADCGLQMHHEGMHFDHREGVDKVRDIAKLRDRVASLDAIKEELKKCDLVCAGCHRLRSRSRRVHKLVYSCTAHPVHDSGCKKCYIAEYGHQRQIDARNFINSLKDRPCLDCNTKFEPLLMDFDHRPGSDKIMDISTACSYGWRLDRLKTEVDKCDLICCWCHVQRTVNRKVGASF